MNTQAISRYFTYREALLLPRWMRLATESDGLTDQILLNLQKIFATMDDVRDYFKAPIYVHCAYRPPAYNKLIGGAEHSAHIDGLAVDFEVHGMPCSEAISLILRDEMLEEWGMRMEDNGDDPSWIHLDLRAPKTPYDRYFKP